MLVLLLLLSVPCRAAASWLPPLSVVAACQVQQEGFPIPASSVFTAAAVLLALSLTRFLQPPATSTWMISIATRACVEGRRRLTGGLRLCVLVEALLLETITASWTSLFLN